ncbi:amino acid kinase family protein [Cysteiniphilum sp. 19S12-1]|uniref:amino acid kinase family protein n=1 Tax=Cysteiniphilum sp. 19S12-1 TaxID=3453130 RepID=UPI003F829F8A
MQKYGGSCIKSIRDFDVISEKIINSFCGKQQKIVVVVSAMFGETDSLMSLAETVASGSEIDKRDLDYLINIGEQKSSSLLAIAINSKTATVKAKAYACWQIGIFLNEDRLPYIKNWGLHMLEHDVSNGIVPIICGFQALNNQNNDIFTLGRNGSDTTAVMLAIALNSDLEIYKDIGTLNSCDPKIFPNISFPIEKIDYAMLNRMSDNGCDFFPKNSLTLASKSNLKCKIKSLTSDEVTLVSNDYFFVKSTFLIIKKSIIFIECSFVLGDFKNSILRFGYRFKHISSNGKNYFIIYCDDSREKYRALKFLETYTNNFFSLKSDYFMISLLTATSTLASIKDFFLKNYDQYKLILFDSDSVYLLFDKSQYESLIHLINNTDCQMLFSKIEEKVLIW